MQYLLPLLAASYSCLMTSCWSPALKMLLRTGHLRNWHLHLPTWRYLPTTADYILHSTYIPQPLRVHRFFARAALSVTYWLRIGYLLAALSGTAYCLPLAVSPFATVCTIQTPYHSPLATRPLPHTTPSRPHTVRPYCVLRSA